MSGRIALPFTFSGHDIMRKPALSLLLACLAPGLAALPPHPLRAEVQIPGPAQTVEDLSRILRIPAIIGVMQLEGLDYGRSLKEEMFPGQGGDAWAATVALIYDEPTMRARFGEALAAELGDDPDTVAASAAYFDTPLGQRILTLEIEARRALMDKSVEEAALEHLQGMIAADDPRLDRLRNFATVNDLVEANVQGALNANLGFYQGMAEADAFDEDMTEDDMLAEVWGQEDQVRKDTVDWLFPFLALAYGPLSDAELQSYIDFSATPAGQKLNTALFAAFDAVFVRISRDLGRAVAHQIAGEDI